VLHLHPYNTNEGKMTTHKTIFIIDDEPDMIKIASDLLESDQYLVRSATHPEQGLKEISNHAPDLLLLDVRLPDKDGFQVLKELKNDPKTKTFPIIMVSVKSDEADVVVGLELGAEDYIIKPFRKRELLARVKTALRRSEFDQNVQIMEIAPLKVDFGKYQAFHGKKELSLTPKEFELLGFFMMREGQVVTRHTLSEKIWGIEFTGSTRTIDVHVDQLRRKLGKLSTWIKGLKGVGYRFEKD